MLRNHGLATTGTSVEEAFQRLRCIVQACEIQVSQMPLCDMIKASDVITGALIVGNSVAGRNLYL